MHFFITHQLREIWKQASIWIILSLLIFLVERVGWSSALRSVTTQALQPFQYLGMTTTHIAEFPLRWMEGQRSKAEEVRALKTAYAQALSQISELETLKKENETLRQMIEKKGNSGEKKMLVAPIISYSLTAIASGSEAGIREGALVYVADTLVGRVTKVEERQSLVTLFSDPTSEPILVKTESNTQGLLVGKGQRLEVTQIPVQAAIHQGERVVTIGQPGIPPDQFVGVIASVRQAQTAPTQTALVDQLNSFYATSLVEVK